jgi:hypothetical protein
LKKIVSILAHQMHETWSLSRIEAGWKYGSTRDEHSMVHPALKPWKQCPADDRAWNTQTAIAIVKMIVVLGYKIVAQPKFDIAEENDLVIEEIDTDHKQHHKHHHHGDDTTVSIRSNTDTRLSDGPLTNEEQDTVHQITKKAAQWKFESEGSASAETYKPTPIQHPTDFVHEELILLVEEMATNLHDIWAHGKKCNGHDYSDRTSEETKKHRALLPYAHLHEEDREASRKVVQDCLGVIVALGHDILHRSDGQDTAGEFTGIGSQDQLGILQKQIRHMSKEMFILKEMLCELTKRPKPEYFDVLAKTRKFEFSQLKGTFTQADAQAAKRDAKKEFKLEVKHGLGHEEKKSKAKESLAKD